MNRIPSGSANAGYGRTKSTRTRTSRFMGGALRRVMVVFGSVALAGSIFSIYAGSSGAVVPPGTAAPGNECPGVGSDTGGCQFLIVLNANGTSTITQSSTAGSDTPFDGNDDTLVGIYNNSGATISSIGLSASTDIFGFDGDGICGKDHGVSYTWVGTGLNGGGFSGCPYGTTGYEGPWVTFSNYSSANHYETGTVSFTTAPGGGLADQSTTFFSLESKLSAANFTVPTTTTTTTAPTTTTTAAPTTTTTVAGTTTTAAPTTTTTAGGTLPPPPPPPPPAGGATTTTAPVESSTTTVATTTTTAPPITTTTVTVTPPTSPPTTVPNIPPATVPSGAPTTGVGGAATSSDNGVLLTASGMTLFAGLAGLVLIARRRRRA
jgi:hypothetical protein